MPVVTSITLLPIKRAEAKAARKLSFAEVATPGAAHLELMLAGEMQWAMQQALARKLTHQVSTRNYAAAIDDCLAADVRRL